MNIQDRRPIAIVNRPHNRRRGFLTGLLLPIRNKLGSWEPQTFTKGKENKRQQSGSIQPPQAGRDKNAAYSATSTCKRAQYPPKTKRSPAFDHRENESNLITSTAKG
tara:strand:- start:866 stop:1186 length:321 start_codon:yes stop_codon:yes gene_type:complete